MKHEINTKAGLIMEMNTQNKLINSTKLTEIDYLLSTEQDCY